MLTAILRGIALALSLSFSWSALAHSSGEPKVMETEVNGFSVHLIDLQHGNQFGYVFTVPYGSSDDDPKNLGRAHFFEHMYARGSKRYPGHETLIKAITGFGLQRNAATSFEHTYYYATGKEDHALEAMRMHLASIEEPELEASSIVREKATVINEVVASAPNRPTNAIFSLPFHVLPKADHPLKGQLTGTLQTLEPMSAEQLREIHRNIYHSGNVKIAVFGNFTSGMHSREKVIAELKAALPAPTTEPRPSYKPAVLPEIFADNAVLDIYTPNNNLGALFVPLAPDADINAVNMFLAVFSSRFRGSMTDATRRGMGLAEFVTAEAFRAGNQHYVMIDFRMTEAGYKNREELAQYILNTVKEYQTDLVPAGIVEQLKKSTVHNYKQGERDIEGLVSNYSHWLLEEAYKHHVNMDWAAAAATISPENIQKGAKSLRADRKVGVFMGPDANRATEHSPFFNLKYGVHPWSKPALATPVPKPSKLIVPKIPTLEKFAPTRQLVQWQKHVDRGVFEVYDFDPSWTDRSIMMRLQFAPLTPAEQISFQLWLSVIKDELVPELTALGADGIRLSIGANLGEMVITAQGETGREATALVWLVERIRSLSMNTTIFELVRRSAELTFRRVEEGFPGQAAIGLLRELIAPREQSSLLMLDAVSRSTPQMINEFIDHKLSASNKTLIVAGAFNPLEIKKVKDAFLTLSPEPLNGDVQTLLPARSVNQTLVYNESWRDAAQGGVGYLRVFSGPHPEQLRERASIGMIVELLREEIFLRNRPLGYMQGAASLSNPQAGHVVLYGQVGTEAELAKLTSVWDEELARYQNREVKPEELEKARTGYHASLSERASSSDKAVEEILTSLNMSGQPFYSDRLAAAVKDVTHEEIQAAFDQYLATGRPNMTVAKGLGQLMPCEVMLMGRAAVRELLKVK